jgi:DNA-binding CsgD family transcriptional regulator
MQRGPLDKAVAGRRDPLAALNGLEHSARRDGSDREARGGIDPKMPGSVARRSGYPAVECGVSADDDGIERYLEFLVMRELRPILMLLEPIVRFRRICQARGLSQAESQVAILHAGGLTYGEMATLKVVSLETVKTQLRRATAKLGEPPRRLMARLRRKSCPEGENTHIRGTGIMKPSAKV